MKKWRKNGVWEHDRIPKSLENKGDVKLYEIGNCGLAERRQIDAV